MNPFSEKGTSVDPMDISLTKQLRFDDFKKIAARTLGEFDRTDLPGSNKNTAGIVRYEFSSQSSLKTTARIAFLQGNNETKSTIGEIKGAGVNEILDLSTSVALQGPNSVIFVGPHRAEADTFVAPLIQLSGGEVKINPSFVLSLDETICPRVVFDAAAIATQVADRLARSSFDK